MEIEIDDKMQDIEKMGFFIESLDGFTDENQDLGGDDLASESFCSKLNPDEHYVGTRVQDDQTFKIDVESARNIVDNLVNKSNEQILQRFTERVRSKTAMASYVEAGRRAIRNFRAIAQYPQLDETDLIDSNETYYDVATVPTVDRDIHIARRNIEVSSLYTSLGCQANVDMTNCYGSYREIAIAALMRKNEWTTTSVVSWLLSLVKGDGPWEGPKKPYTSLLSNVPVQVKSYLDYGCGSGHGAIQVAKYLGMPEVVHGYDIEDVIVVTNKPKLQYRNKLLDQYDLVTMVNVLHHVQDASYVMYEVMKAVKPGGILLIKDHFVSSVNVLLAVLVHEIYEPTGCVQEPEALYFRDSRKIIDLIRHQGWTVDVVRVPGSDVGDLILVCRNLRDGGRSQILALEEQVVKLTEEVRDLKLMVSNKFNNNNYEVPSIKSQPLKRRNKVVGANDLHLAKSLQLEKQKERKVRNERVQVLQEIVTTPAPRWRPKETGGAKLKEEIKPVNVAGLRVNGPKV
jgi:SAM-dependent methyltransferase